MFVLSDTYLGTDTHRTSTDRLSF